MREDTLELFHRKEILVDTKTHCDAIDALLDIHIADSFCSTATVTISNMADDALVLTRLHKSVPRPVYYEDLFSPSVTFMRWNAIRDAWEWI